MKNSLLVLISLFLFSCDDVMEDVTPYTTTEIDIETINNCDYVCDYYYYGTGSIVDVRMNYFYFELENSPYFGIKLHRYNDSYVLHVESASELDVNRNVKIALSDGSIVELEYTAWQFDVGANIWSTRYNIYEDELFILMGNLVDRIYVPFVYDNNWQSLTQYCHQTNLSSQISCTQS